MSLSLKNEGDELDMLCYNAVEYVVEACEFRNQIRLLDLSEYL